MYGIQDARVYRALNRQLRHTTPLIIYIPFTFVSSTVSLEDILGVQPKDPVDPVIDAAETLEELEVETFEEIVAAELAIPRRTMSPKKCCKIGKKVAESGLYCNIDLMQVRKYISVLFQKFII